LTFRSFDIGKNWKRFLEGRYIHCEAIHAGMLALRYEGQMPRLCPGSKPIADEAPIQVGAGH
jgi:hypothetical protein